MRYEGIRGSPSTGIRTFFLELDGAAYLNARLSRLYPHEEVTGRL
jgi:hypothetical protein